uniref:IF rod domain-containing protein n=1 Tax=Electrophorus electricus TaxID=8005 RepID=A0A4W4H8A2_ELEEL
MCVCVCVCIKEASDIKTMCNLILCKFDKGLLDMVTVVRQGNKTLQEARAELTEVRKRWHSLQVEMESLHALERGLQSSLLHTQHHYSLQLRDLSHSVHDLEVELEGMRDGLAVQRQQHSQLLNTKMKLEREIATYRRLLEHEEELIALHGQISHLLLCTIVCVCVCVRACVRNRTEKIDKVIKQWEGSFFKGNPKLRKKSVSLRFDLHMAVADEGCGQTSQDSLPDVEVRLVMRRCRSIPSITQ